MTDPVVALVGVAFAVAGFDAVFRLDERVDLLPDLPNDESGTLQSDLWKWVFAGLVVGYVFVVEGNGLASIGIEWPGAVAFAGWTLAGTAGTMVAGSLAYVTYDRLDLTAPGEFVDEQVQRSIRARAFTALTAGVTETVLYQAYPIERLAPLLGNLPAAATVSFLAFTGVHYVGDTFSLEETVYIGVPALCMTVLWVVTGNFLVVATAHALVDGISLLAPELSDERDAETPAPD